ncbi:hypothetical protein [Rhizobium leguminosarum]
MPEQITWKSWEHVSHREIKYKWRHAWKEKPGDDYVAFDGDTQIGRIFRSQVGGVVDNRWFWIVATDGSHRLDWPSAGYEDSAYVASRRLEMIYESIRSGKQRTAHP